MKLGIDPGHGMSNRKRGVYDPGACHGTLQEADIVLIWGHTLRLACEAVDIPVFMTRTTRDESAPLSTRVARAKQAGCTHFLSLHVNDSDNLKANGIETLYEGTPKAKFAGAIQRLLIRETRLTNRGAVWASIDRKRNLAVLKFPGPCALLELGFIANPVDMKTILDAEVMKRTCQALAEHLKASAP